MSLHHQPLPRSGLGLDNTTHLHRTGNGNSTDQTKAERHFVGNHLHGTTHGRHYRIFVVGPPTGKENTQYANRTDSRHKKHTHIEVKHVHALIPRKERECANRSHNHQERSNVIKQAVGLVHHKDFLDEHLQYISKHLQQAPRAHAHRSNTALKISTYLTFHEDQHNGYQGVCQQDAYTHKHTLYQNSRKISETQSLAKQQVYPI